VEAHGVFRGRQTALQTVKERKTRVRFQMSDELAHGGLRDVQNLRGAANRAAFYHGLEGLDLPKIEVAGHSIT
jgi:hypothetical protein